MGSNIVMQQIAKNRGQTNPSQPTKQTMPQQETSSYYESEESSDGVPSDVPSSERQKHMSTEKLAQKGAALVFGNT